VTVIGIDIGGTNIRAGVLRGGRLTAVTRRVHRESAYGERSDYERILSVIAGLIRELNHAGKAEGVGVSISGVLSADRSLLVSNMNLQWFDKAVAADLARRTGLPTAMENDGNCAAWGEYLLGAGRGQDPFVLLTLGTGVGGGTVVNGELVRGRYGAAGELGHICVVAGGRECGCGGLGCVEQYSSGRALLGEYARLTLSSGDSGAAAPAPPANTLSPVKHQELQARYAAALAAGELAAVRALEAITRPVSVALAQVARMVDPALIALAGGVSALGEPLLTALRSDMAAYPAVPSRRVRVPVVLGELGENAGLAGAALLAKGRLAADPAEQPPLSG
jgi:glucokinase